MSARVIGTREDWRAARVALLAKEKEHDKRRDALSAERRALPWVPLDKKYVFDGPSGKTSLLKLFGDHRQLVVYHFMLDPSWEDGCKSCSLLADTFDGAQKHLRGRDTAFAAVSRAPLAKIEKFKARMGWTFPWVSSFETDFNQDFHVSNSDEDRASGKTEYNFAIVDAKWNEKPGASTFAREGDRVFHTYSTYGRGLDILIGTYNYLDLTPFGRDEGGKGMSWVKHHDKYGA